MSFDTPTNTAYTTVDDGLYIVQLRRFDDMPDTGRGYGPGKKWVFYLWNKSSREPVTNEDGTAYEFYQFSSTKMTPGSKARGWFDIFLGRPVVDGENPADMEIGAFNKYAEALIGTEIVEGKDRSKILKLSLVQAKQQGKAKADPEPELVGTPGRARQSRRSADR